MIASPTCAQVPPASPTCCPGVLLLCLVSSGAAVNSLKCDLATFKFQEKGGKLHVGGPWGFRFLPHSSAFKFCRTSINNAAG